MSRPIARRVRVLWGRMRKPGGPGQYEREEKGCLRLSADRLPNSCLRGLGFGLIWMGNAAGIHIALSVAWVGPYGANGLIAADAVNMALRIAYSLVFAHRRFESLPSFRLRGLLPSTGTLLALTASSIAATLSSAFLLEREGQPAFQPFLGFIATLPRDGAVVAWGFPARAALHVATGGICFFVSAAVIYFLERQLLSEIRNLKTHSD